MKFLFVLTALMFSTGAHAASKDAIQAVLSSQAMQVAEEKFGHDLVQIKETAVYRCPGCFSFEVIVGRGDQTKTLEFGTQGHIQDGKMIYSVGGGAEKGAAVRCIALGRVGGEDKACARHSTQAACESKDKWEWCQWH